MSRPEYIKCVKHTHAEKLHLTWCDKPSVGFVFQTLDHAAYVRQQSGRLLICPECKAKILQTLQS